MGSRSAPLRTTGAPALLVAAAAATFGFGLSRTLAEAFYLSCRWLTGWPGTLSVTAAVTLLVLIAWRWLVGVRREDPAGGAHIFLPLFLPLIYLFQHRVDPAQASAWLLGSALLTAVLALIHRSHSIAARTLGKYTGPLLAAAITMGIYARTMGQTVGRADTFEFQVVANNLGIAHPPGYPLFVLLGKLFTLLPVGTIAFRVNLLSAVCAVGATLLVYATLRQLIADAPLWLPILGGLAFAFSPTLWSQAVEAEVYTLNSLLVAFVLWSLVRLIGCAHCARDSLLPALGLALGLGLTSHLTTVILLPPVVLALLLARPRLYWQQMPVRRTAILFLAGLSLYLYLPLRWPALHQGALMPLREFIDWVVGGRFKGALHLDAWLSDPTRYAIVGRMVLDQWGWPGAALAFGGLLWLTQHQWRTALITMTIWAGYAFYAICYYVPDISVFLIPAHLVMAVWMGCGAMTAIWIVKRLMKKWLVDQRPAGSVAAIVFAVIPLLLITRNLPSIDRSGPNPLEDWGRHVLTLDLDARSAILADSEKIAPLYYLQQTEGLRPDIDIMVLPDEATYRAELDARIAAGQTVYLARFLPALEGVYHLRSVPGAAGPLVEVSPHPMASPPALDGRLDARFGPSIVLLGFAATEWRTSYPNPFRITLYWTTSAPVDATWKVWLRLVDDEGNVQWKDDGMHPAGNYYPTSAWRPGEIIVDAHEVPLPPSLAPGDYQLQVAMLAPFANASLMPSGEASPWLTVGVLGARPPQELPAPRWPARVWTDGTVILGVDMPIQSRPGAELPVTLIADDITTFAAKIGWAGSPETAIHISSSTIGGVLAAPTENGEHTLVVWMDGPLRCGWLRPPAESCSLAQLVVEGAPLPAGAVNFDDLIALLSTDIHDLEPQPGGTLDVTFEWQALTPVTEDYTVFVHLLDAADKIVGQVDAWPVHGTYPTSQWLPGGTITDRHTIAVGHDAVPGPYRLEIGWYLLSTMRRLNVLDPAGNVTDDRVLLEGLAIPEP